MSYENWISYRYLKTNKGRFISFLNFVSISGIAIGVMALIVVIGVMTGFGNNLREKIIGTTPHVMIEKETGVKNYQDILNQVKSIEGVEGAAPYVQGNIFIESSGQALGLVVRGIDIDHEAQVTSVGQYLKEGKLSDLGAEKIIIGSELARYFGYSIGDQLTLISPGSGIAGEGWRYELEVAGIFSTGVSDYDTNLVIVNLKQAQQIFNFDETTSTGIGVKLTNPDHANDVKLKINEMLGFGFLVKTWVDMNRNLFEALFLEKWGLFIILTLMVLVASFNIISTLIVTVTSKVHDIGILQSIGVPKRSIRTIFIKQGIYIGLLGIFWGLASGLGISYVLHTFVEVPEQIYSIDRVPVDIQAFDVAAIVFSAFFICFFATIYPASKAAGLQPVDALRYE